MNAWRTLILVGLAGLLPSPAAAQSDAGKGLLTKAIIAFGRGDLETAKQRLEEAEDATTEPGTLALIHRQRGIVFEVEGARLAAVKSFLTAFYFDPALDLPEREHRGDVVRLFDCAKRLHGQGVKEVTVEARWSENFASSSWSCPDATEPEPPPPPPPAVEPPPPPPPPPAIVETVPVPPPEDDEGGVLSSPVFWIVTGVVVAGGATAGVLLLSQSDPYGGTTGVNIQLSGD